KKQARDAVRDTAESADMPYVNHRWLGGLLTNFHTISQRIKRLHDLERYETEGQLDLLPTRERMTLRAKLGALRANLDGVKDMQRVPDAVFVIDLKTEAIAVREAQRLRIPIIGLVDTNCDPDGIDYVIPGNDDAIRSCAAVTRAIGEVVAQGHNVFRTEEEPPAPRKRPPPQGPEPPLRNPSPRPPPSPRQNPSPNPSPRQNPSPNPSRRQNRRPSPPPRPPRSPNPPPRPPERRVHDRGHRE